MIWWGKRSAALFLLLVSACLSVNGWTVQVRTFDFQAGCVGQTDLLVGFLGLPAQPERATPPQGARRFEVDTQRLRGKAATAHRHLRIVLDFFRQEFNYPSLDGRGTGIYLLTNLAISEGDTESCDPMNAFYANMSEDRAHVIAVLYGHQASPVDLGSDLDVLGHEFSHGVYRSSQGLVQALENKAINEGVSDMFGITIRAWHESGGDLTQTRVRENTFMLGQHYGMIANRYHNLEHRTPQGYMRNLLNPMPWFTADHYQLWQEERFQDAHAASGIVSLPFALMVKGGGHPRLNDVPVQVQPIGFEKSIRIIFYVLQHRLPFNTMPEFANAAVKAAERMFGVDSPEAMTTRNAFTVTGLITPYRPTGPSPAQDRPSTDLPAVPSLPAPDVNREESSVPAGSLSGPIFLSVLALFFVGLFIAGTVLVRRRRLELIALGATTQTAASHKPVPGKQVGSSVASLPPDSSQSVAKHDVLVIAGEASVSLSLSVEPLCLGRSSALPLPLALKQVFQKDAYIAREHCLLWYRADTHQVYVQCLSENGVRLNNQTLAFEERAKVQASGTVSLLLGRTRLQIHHR